MGNHALRSLSLSYTQKKSGAKMVPQRSRFGKRLLFGKEGPFFCGQENGPSEELFWLLFFSECTQRSIGGWGPANPSLGMAPSIKLYSAVVFCSRCRTKRRIGRTSFFGMTTTKILRHIFQWHSSCRADRWADLQLWV